MPNKAMQGISKSFHHFCSKNAATFWLPLIAALSKLMSLVLRFGWWFQQGANYSSLVRLINKSRALFILLAFCRFKAAGL